MKLSRRGWWKMAAGAAAGAGMAEAVVAGPPSTVLYDILDEQEYLGFTIKWTGWKPSSHDLGWAGQWIARPSDGVTLVAYPRHPWGASGIYSSFPGPVDYYNEGNCFDLSCSEKQGALAYPQPMDKDRMQAARQMAFSDIRKFIRENCVGEAKPMKFPGAV